MTPHPVLSLSALSAYLYDLCVRNFRDLLLRREHRHTQRAQRRSVSVKPFLAKRVEPSHFCVCEILEVVALQPRSSFLEKSMDLDRITSPPQPRQHRE